ncbi:MAG: Zn-dependent hydrolase [Oscillospiraceae bacterium]|nr:Zn-dependent hydrolase [Oscillospiraceae bacterium]
MKKTYITTMPDRIGAFLKASQCFASLGINITRVSYNKAIDSYTLFIDADGTPEQLKQADAALTEIGYLQSDEEPYSVILLEFMLEDKPGGVLEILSLINEYDFNISYISSQENGSEYQFFKMGLLVSDSPKISEFLANAEKICKVRVINYNHTENIYDNSIFYKSFVSQISESIGLSSDMREKLLIDSNLAMQILDEQGLSPYKTFDSVGRFAGMLADYRGDSFLPRITRHKITKNTEAVLIEPPCGSNTTILLHGDEALFIDSGYACYREEMEEIFRSILPNYDHMEKTILITHADVDHCGLLPCFDKVLTSRKTANCLRAEYNGQVGFREKNKLHSPYISICKTLTNYIPVNPEKIIEIGGTDDQQNGLLVQIGFFNFGDLHLEVYEGQGGHLSGEIILIDYTNHVAFTGDVYVNIQGFTPEQAKYNQYAPILMTSVDTDPDLCTAERKEVFARLGCGNWQIFGGHGAKKEYTVCADNQQKW